MSDLPQGDAGRRLAFLLHHLSALGHDLRNPISGLLLGIQRLGRGGPGEGEKATALLARMERAVRSMDRLIETLLELGRTESGRLELERTAEPPGDVVARAVEIAGGLSGEGRRTLALDVPASLPAPAWDGARTARAVAHLLAAAVEFTPAGGTVRLSAREADGGIRFEVEDGGRPPAPGELEVLYEGRAGRAGDRVRTRAHGPYLYLARRIAELHGGRTEARPGARGGVAYALWIPLAASGAGAPGPAAPAVARSAAAPAEPAAPRRAFSVSIFCRHGGALLLVRHRRLGTWLPVGGEVEPGETPLEAARRELREETGLEGRFPPGRGVDGTPPGLVGYEEHAAGSKGLHLNFAFVADVASRELAPCDEWDGARWVTADELASLPCPENVRQLGRIALGR